MCVTLFLRITLFGQKQAKMQRMRILPVYVLYVLH